MAAGKGRKLVIVESPAKAKTIAGYLGGDFEVEASVGHIRDLPNPSELPADMKKGPYGKFAVDVALLLLVPVDHVVGLEAMVDVDGELAVRALLHVRRQLAGVGQVADVADRGLHVVVLAQVAGDRLGLG